MTGTAIPALPQLLSSSTDLVDLQLHEIPMAGYFSPQTFASVLSGASRLRSLSLHFLSFPPRRNYIGLPSPDGHRIALPALTCLKYRGTSKYLDDFVARIDAPRLGNIDITFFSQPTIDASQLGQFIHRIPMSFSEAYIRASMHAISISLKNSGASTRLQLQIPCKQLDWQLSSMAQVCDQLSLFAFGVQHLVFNTNDWSSEQDDVHGEERLQLVGPFGSTRNIAIAGELTTRILSALQLTDEGYTTDTNVLLSLRNLRVQNTGPFDKPFWDAAHSLNISQRLSSRPIKLQFVCHVCDISFTSGDFKDHLVVWHEYERVCSYCGDFQLTLEYIHLFQEHLRSEHPEVVQNDEFISQSLLTSTPLQIDTVFETLADRHSSLRELQFPQFEE